jgi:hypothetical protein
MRVGRVTFGKDIDEEANESRLFIARSLLISASIGSRFRKYKARAR